MASIVQVRALATRLGASVDEHEHEIYVDAPAGHEWASDAVHALSVQTSSTMREPAFKREALDSLLARMRSGLILCNQDCERD